MAYRRKIPPKPTIADECEAFLAGRSWQLCEAASWSMPVWARFNRLARGSHDDLVDVARWTIHPGRAAPVLSWDAVLALLAQRMLSEADGQAALLALQARVLVPLEVQLFGEGAAGVHPDEFFEFVLHHLSGAAHDDQDRSP